MEAAELRREVVVVVAAVLALVLILPYQSLTASFELRNTAFQELGVDVWWVGMSAVVVISSGVLVAVLLLVLHRTQARLPAMLPIGAGLLLLAGGLALLLLSGQDMTLLMVSTVLTSCAEVLIVPFLISRLAADLPWRLTTLIIGGWLLVSRLGFYTLGQLAGFEAGSTEPMWIAAGLSALAGPLLLALAMPAERLVRQNEAPLRRPR